MRLLERAAGRVVAVTWDVVKLGTKVAFAFAVAAAVLVLIAVGITLLFAIAGR